MRVVTYASPFELKANAELWNLITRHPHFCASDTLVQGLSNYYGRKAFNTIRPVQELVESFFKEYADNPVNDMQIFLTASEAIRHWPESDLRTSFLFNKAEVVNAIQLLLPLFCDPDLFGRDSLPPEQRAFLDLLKAVQKSSCTAALNTCKSKSIEDYRNAVDAVSVKEVEFILQRKPKGFTAESWAEVIGVELPIRSISAAVDAAEKAIQYQNKHNDFFSFSKTSNMVEAVSVAVEQCHRREEEYYNTIIIHGVHQITPILYFLFRKLSDIDVEVVFLINYANNLPSVYKTWEEVYRWCDVTFEYAAPLDLTHGNIIGKNIADLLEGKSFSSLQKDIKLKKFDNLSSFTDHEVGETFIAAKRSLHDMKTQYYAVKGDQCNEILQMYFPEQFKQKPFLSYPIGQFILGLYRMWDQNEQRLKINRAALAECVVSDVFGANQRLLETLQKTEVAFSDVDSYADYIARIELIEHIQEEINYGKLKDWTGLKKISFINISKEELEELRNYIDFIREITDKVFRDLPERVDFLKHYRRLLDIILSPEATKGTLSKAESDLIAEISKRLGNENDSVTGHPQDVKDALAFFLSGRKKSDTSNWIVRDFEQIDGAALLSSSEVRASNTKADAYQFCLLSNEHMTRGNNADLPWPITTEMFYQYQKAWDAVSVAVVSQQERRNLLRYLLFYGAFFSRVSIEFSYLSEEGGETQSPYYLFSALGLKFEPYEENVKHAFSVPPREHGTRFALSALTDEERELFAVCSFKYLLNKVLGASIEYSSEFHIKYYLSFVLAYVVRKKIGRSNAYAAELNKGLEILKKCFPFWGETVFADIRMNAEKSLRTSTFYSKDYKRKRENFLLAKWKDQTTGKEQRFSIDNADERLKEYMLSAALYPTAEELPLKMICDNCSYSGICLRALYDAHIQEGK